MNLPLKNAKPAADAVPPIGKLAIFANPIAGKGRGQAIAQELRDRLAERSIGATLLFQPPSDAPAELIQSIDAMIVIGGDGTLRSAVRRCLQISAQVPPILLVPMGTANLMGKHLGLRWNPRDPAKEIVQTILKGRIRMIDAARANWEVCLIMAGIGLDSVVVREVDRQRNGPIRYASYVLPTLWAMAHFPFTPLKVTIDGELAFPFALAMAFVGNIAEYGTGFPVLPLARPDDGLLDVCVVPTKSRGEMIEQFLRAAAGEHWLAPGAVYARGKQIIVESEKPMPVQVDGDPAGFTPVRFDLLPSRLAFIVPTGL